MRYITIDRSTLMDLGMAIVKKVFHSWNKVSNYTLRHIKLKLSIYSCVPLVDQLTPMGFIPFGASIGIKTMLEYKHSNYLFIAHCLKWA